MLKKISAVFLCACAAAVLMTACGGNTTAETGSSAGKKLKVVVSFNAMLEISRAVGGEKVDISTMIPDGTEPHDYEPKAKDLQALATAQVFVYNGLGMEKWADDAVSSAGGANLVSVEASKGCTPISSTDQQATAENGKEDPHLWLSLKGAELEAKNVEQAFAQADPSNADYYAKNTARFTEKLESLYKEYAAKFKSVSNKSFVTGHAAFAYLCRDFGLSQKSVEGVFAEGEPSAKGLAELVDYCKKNSVKTIFVEDMVSPKVSNTLASQVGAKVETIHTLESSEGDADYLSRMKDNLRLIYESLK